MQFTTRVWNESPVNYRQLRYLGKVLWAGNLDTAPFLTTTNGGARLWAAAVAGYRFRTRTARRRFADR